MKNIDEYPALLFHTLIIPALIIQLDPVMHIESIVYFSFKQCFEMCKVTADNQMAKIRHKLETIVDIAVKVNKSIFSNLQAKRLGFYGYCSNLLQSIKCSSKWLFVCLNLHKYNHAHQKFGLQMYLFTLQS